MELQYIVVNSILKFGPILTFLIYFLSLILLFIFSGYFKFELQVHEIVQRSVSKNIIHGIWYMLSPIQELASSFPHLLHVT